MIYNERNIIKKKNGGTTMKIEELKKKKQELKLTTAQLSLLSGVPAGTINKILSGETKSPRIDTLTALEEAIAGEMRIAGRLLHENILPYGAENGSYTTDDYYTLPDDMRAELIDGRFYVMEAPGTVHQALLLEISYAFTAYIKESKCPYRPFFAPFDVRLCGDDRTMVQPDFLVVSKGKGLCEKGLIGAPDFALEITSPATRMRDGGLKLTKYREAGVQEYWIVDLQKKRVLTYCFVEDALPAIYSFDDAIPVHIFKGGLTMNFSRMMDGLDEW